MSSLSSEVDSSESEDMEECMKVFLNGISISDLAWENCIEEVEPTNQFDSQKDSNGTRVDLSNDRRSILKNTLQQSIGEDLAALNDYWWTYAFSNTADLRPPMHVLQIVDHSSIGRGYALTSKQFIPSGTILYTERALFACQVPENDTAIVEDNRLGANWHLKSLFKVLACQQCFRSLEPISSCCIDPSKSDKNSTFPLSHLYPVPDFQWDSSPQSNSFSYAVDRHGRVACLQCNTLFCSLSCYNSFQDQYGSCCLMFQTMRQLPNLLRQRHDTSQESCSGEHCSEIDNEGDFVSIQPAIPLAIRMFVAMLQYYRSKRLLSDELSSVSLFNTIDDLCGISSDIQLLELGISQTNQAAGDEFTSTLNLEYSLEPIYLHLVDVYSMTIEERQNTFSLEYLMAVTAKAARNCFGLRTQSPFQTYYAGIVRSHYTRGSDAHNQVQRSLATALGSATGSFERGMDQKVNDLVSPEIAAFYPLTSRINHSCSPNAEVRSQQFVDFYIDLVAKTDITAGSEICISYIHIGRKSTGRRQRELLAKYMFQCTCTLCAPTLSV